WPTAITLGSWTTPTSTKQWHSMLCGWPCCSSQPEDMARSTCSAVTKESAASTQTLPCSLAYCAGTRILRCRSRKSCVTFGLRFSPLCHHSTEASPPSASIFTLHNGPAIRRPTVETIKKNGSSSDACPARRLASSSSLLLHPASSKITSACRPRVEVCSADAIVQRDPVA